MRQGIVVATRCIILSRICGGNAIRSDEAPHKGPGAKGGWQRGLPASYETGQPHSFWAPSHDATRQPSCYTLIGHRKHLMACQAKGLQSTLGTRQRS